MTTNPTKPPRLATLTPHGTLALSDTQKEAL